MKNNFFKIKQNTDQRFNLFLMKNKDKIKNSVLGLALLIGVASTVTAYGNNINNNNRHLNINNNSSYILKYKKSSKKIDKYIKKISNNAKYYLNR